MKSEQNPKPDEKNVSDADLSKAGVNDEEPRKKPHRGVYLLPNLFTTFGLFAGFYAVILAIQGDRFDLSAMAIILAMLLDGVDGRVARMTNTQSSFGAQYDSLADMVSFGVAPALVIYLWSLQSMAGMGIAMERLGWAAAFFYTAMAGLRLARFNVQIGKVEKKYFRGLASPAAATLLMSFIWVCETQEMWKLIRSDMWVYSLPMIIVGGVLMISPINYISFKDENRDGKIPFSGALLIVLLLVLVILDPPKVFFGVFFIYALSGPALTTYWKVRKFTNRKENPSV